MFKLLAPITLAFLLIGCATKSNDIAASYVSPLRYNSYSCVQMEQEYARVLAKSSQINAQQDDAATDDAVAMGVGLILFWPALFFIDGEGNKGEVARLKGELNVIEEVLIQKGC